jgi:translation initiation factor IF-2
MVDVTVEKLAEIVGTPADRLLNQMQEAGLPHAAIGDIVTDPQKQILLTFLKRSHGAESEAPKKITLKRRTLSTLKSSGAAGRGRVVNVEVRKKRTYIKRGVATPSPLVEPVSGTATPEITKGAEEEATRRAAHVQAEAESEQRKAEAAKREAEIKAQEEIKEAEKAEAAKAAETKAAPTAKTAATAKKREESVAESKISSRKDRRDRHDLDEEAKHTEAKGKRSLTDRQKRASIEEELLPEEEDSETAEPATTAESSTLVLGKGARTKRPGAFPKMGKRHAFERPEETITHEVEIGESITVASLAQKMSVKAAEVIKVLMNLDVMATINQSLDQETAILVVEEMGHTVRLFEENAIERELAELLVYEGEEELRAPVVTVMGHVDHGKTSLLDYIRKTQVADQEAGGITQHIGAYRVETEQGLICFIDTPGHAAFTAMRARGANCTDIVILVVAADDGVMPQTEEAIQHAKAAEAPLVVALNKIDKEGVDLERVKNELAGKEVIPDDWGGDTQFIPVSAQTGEGIDGLLEAVLLQAELLELTAKENGPGQGVVIESQLDKGRGPVATLLIQNGTLKQGDHIVAGDQSGRIRAIHDEFGKKITSAGPSTPVSVLGLGGTPAAGDVFLVTTEDKKARELVEFRRTKAKEDRLASPAASLDTLFDSFGEGEIKYLNIVLKADVRGSQEAISSALLDLGNDEVKVKIIAGGVGGITESDVNLAITSNAVIFGFNVRADNAAKKLVEAEGMDLRYYKVIYDIVDDVKTVLSGMLAPEVREEIIGIAEVRDVFHSKKFGQIAGCMVTEGVVYRNKPIRVLRDNVVIFEGELDSLRHFKDEVSDIRNGTECGIGVKNYHDVKVKDQIEVFESTEVARIL